MLKYSRGGPKPDPDPPPEGTQIDSSGEPVLPGEPPPAPSTA